MKYFEGNLSFTPDKKCWALYELDGFQYDFKSIATKKSLWRKLTTFLWNVEKSARILFLPESYTFEEHYAKLMAKNKGPLASFAHQVDERMLEWLQNTYESSGGTQYRVFVSIKVADEPSFLDTVKNAKDLIVKMIKEPVFKLDRLLGFDGFFLMHEEIRMLKEIEDRLYKKIRKSVQLSRVNEADTEWIIRRNFWKNIAVPPERFLWKNDRKKRGDAPADAERVSSTPAGADTAVVDGKRIVRPRMSEFMPLLEGEVDQSSCGSRVLKISQEVDGKQKSSYSTYLTLTDKPDEIYSPGSEFLYALYDLDFPVAVSMYLDVMEHSEVKEKVKAQKLNINDQTDHTATSRVELPQALIESKHEANQLEKDLDDSKFPMFDVSFVFEVSGSDEKELTERVDAVKDYYKSMQFHLVAPAGEQFKLLNDFMPCGDRQCSMDYVHRLSPHFIAAGMFAASKKLGDSQGYFLGTSGIMHMPVFFDPALAPLRNRSASGAILGSLGGGKSYLANYLLWLTTVHGGKGLVFDPKGDRGHWKDYLREFGDELEILELDDRTDDHGKLDPWGIFENINDAAGIAVNIVSFLANLKTDDDEFVSLTEAVEIVKMSPPKKRSMLDLIDQLKQLDDPGRKLARRLSAISNLPYAKLLFHSGERNSLRTNKRLTVLTVSRLSLPESGLDRDDYDITQLLSVALMMSISAFATRFAEEDPNEFTAVLLDEFWALVGTKEGKKLAERLIRTGRSFNSAIIIISQNANDLLDERIKNNLGFKFVFQSTDSDEVKNVLTFLNLEHTPENMELVKTLENGRPLFQDLDGHCGVVNIEVPFEHVHEAFTTTPGQRKKVS
ncbi:ATP-binding protein [Paenibacillus pasadenensis]|nr:ATP-binding protein [Paenibacillus pasadenensis]